jgi:hypothetical protein
MPYSKTLFDNLPLYARLADDMGVLQMVCHIGIQPLLDRTFLMLSQREALFNPYHPAILDDLPWAGQFVGLGAIGNHYLGIGLNPKWSPDVQLDVLMRAPNYWKILGTDPGIIEAISMWLRFNGTIRLYQPVGHTYGSMPRWADYHMSYDQYELENFEDCHILGGTDTFSYYTPHWHRYNSNYFEWDYYEYFGQMLEETPPPQLLSSDPGMAPRHAWKFFDLDKNTWGQIFPDIEVLDIEALPALTKPTNVGWLNYRIGVDLTWDDPRLKPNERVDRYFDMDGFRYDDCLAPPFPLYTETTCTKTVIQEDFDSNYLTCADYFDSLFAFTTTADHHSITTSVEVIDGISGCGYDDLFDAQLPSLNTVITTTRFTLVDDSWFDYHGYFVDLTTETEQAIELGEQIFVGGMGSFYFPSVQVTTLVTQQNTLNDGIVAGALFYYPPGEQETTIVTTTEEEHWDCGSGMEGWMITGYREVEIPAGEINFPDWVIRQLSHEERFSETTQEVFSGFEGATYEDVFAAYALHAKVGERVEETPAALAETNQLFVIKDRPAPTSITTVESVEGFGTVDYQVPLPSDRPPEYWSDFEVEAIVDLEVDLDLVVESPVIPEQLFAPASGLPLEEENFFPELPRQTTRTTVTEDRSGILLPGFLTDSEGNLLLSATGEPLRSYTPELIVLDFEAPIEIATYEMDYSVGASYWIPPAPELPSVVTRYPIYDDVILPGEPFYYGASKVLTTTTVVQPEQQEILKGPADYYSVYGDSFSFEFPYTPPTPARIVQEPIWEKVIYCNVPASWTTFTITGWFEDKVQLPLDENSRLFHPFVDSLNQQASWHLVLQTDTGIIIDTPSSMYWTDGEKRSLSFDRELGLTTLYIEFVLLPDTDWSVTGFTLNLDSKAVKSDQFMRSLFLPKRCIMGFKFLVVGTFSR